VKHYPEEFWEQGSHGHARRLLAEAELKPGVVLDLGCASGPLAEPVQKLGHEYVGADIDAEAVAELGTRGFEAHEIDLMVPEADQLDAVRALVGDRQLRAVLLLDVLEHLLDPGATLRAVARLTEDHPGLQIVVSLPNVSHVDVGIKLLLGRWDLTDIGLLDDTHIRFFTGRLVARTLADAGWVEAAANDVVNPFSDQLFPADAPALRPGTPLRQLLWRVRMAAEPHGETYQFVRRYRFDPDAAAEVLAALDAEQEPVIRGADETFLTAVVHRPDPGNAAVAGRVSALLADLARQADGDIEVLLSRPAESAEGPSRPHADVAVPDELAATTREVVVPADRDWRDVAGAEARGRYVALLDHRTRVTGDYLSTVRRLVDAMPARVVQLGAAMASSSELDGLASVDDRAARFEKVALDPLDLVNEVPLGAVALDAHVIPRQVWSAGGLRFRAEAGDAAPLVLLLSAIEQGGIVRSDEPVVVVHRAVPRNLGDDLDAAAAQLGRQPLVIPEGAGTPLLAHRRTLATVLPEHQALAQEAAAVRGQVESLTAQLHERDNRLAEMDARLAHIDRLPWMRVRRKLGALKRRLR
jgi:2-polyprenyl-3-methyl-5-hydroxy-6-metoxy-1,4-benzoquinol methylase